MLFFFLFISVLFQQVEDPSHVYPDIADDAHDSEDLFAVEERFAGHVSIVPTRRRFLKMA